MEPADIASWIENTQRAIPSSRHRDAKDSKSSALQSSPVRLSWSSKPLLYHPLQTVTPPSSVKNPTRRKQRLSLPATERSSSPRKRQRGQDSDTVLSSSSRNIAVLDSRTVLSATSLGSGSSPKRNNSPTRDHAIELRTSVPSIQTDSLIRADIPKQVRGLRKLLITNFGRSFLPAGLKEVISSDPDLVDEIDDDAYDETDQRAPKDILSLLDNIQRIVANARDCEQNHRDENAWCMDVIQPLLELALKESVSNEWLLQSVQSQRVQTNFLSRTASNALIERKTDYVLSYSHKDPATSELYEKLARNGMRDRLGHTRDSFTKRTALFSGIEVKPSDGGHAQAELQLSVWLAASLRNKARLVETAQRFASTGAKEGTASETQDCVKVFPEPGATIVGHDHQIYYAWIDSDENTTNVGPDDRLSASTRSVRGAFLLLDLYKRILQYGSAGSQYKNWFFGDVLQQLVSGADLEG
ncbi:hypothetical protein P152DRAFT_210105 [Eremomyces bilateralis CBS 781.70]|uniref:PD-(D/E)XK nuclease-like domain-containing protein n=1 Tax=Eremomyces bilateralis CBS 781.70 TaxID=1392243 RepID=A0A6G1FSV3_9PEZI|nr:uncharacterized protein P152DRAFT_210105 [Eremomyces bilateralis CBS 781.70]KAF1808816.1 hypothetical protein P152DRAFT_210105 [Eremomyces bilateralis CBS 781.70]